MKIQVYEEPWRHVVIDDTYDETLLEEFVKEVKMNLKNPEYYVQHKNNAVQSIYHTNNNLYEAKNVLFHRSKSLLNSVDFGEAFMKTHFSDYRSYDNLSKLGESIMCIGETSYPIHDESENKIMSCVTYISPEKSNGTLLYDKDKNFVKEIEWKQNRTLIFCALDNVTWHAYKSTGKSFRLTLNTFLVENGIN